MAKASADVVENMPGGRAPVVAKGSVQFVPAMRILGFRVAFCYNSYL